MDAKRKQTGKKKAKPKARRPRKVTEVKGRQAGKVRTGAVVNVSITQPRTTARRARNTNKAQNVAQSIIPLLTGIQAQSVAATSNLERLQMERDRLAQRAQEHGAKRVEAVQAGNKVNAQDETERMRRALDAKRRVAKEVRIRSEEPMGQIEESSSSESKAPTIEKLREMAGKRAREAAAFRPEEMKKRLEKERMGPAGKAAERRKSIKEAEEFFRPVKTSRGTGTSAPKETKSIGVGETPQRGLPTLARPKAEVQPKVKPVISP